MKKAMALICVLALAAAAAGVCWSLLLGQVEKPSTGHTYKGEEAFTEEGFGEFKAFVGQPGVELLDVRVADNSTDPVTLSYAVEVEDGIDCPYGERTVGEAPYMLAVGATVGAFVLVCFLGLVILNAMGVQRWQ